MKSCTVAGCKREHYAKGLCNKHWQRLRAFGSTDDLPNPKADKGEPRAWIAAHSTFDGPECLIWPFARRSNGYANGAENPLHLMCEAVHGSKPTQDSEVAHSCGRGETGCIHPKHLRWATRLENIRDKFAHGTMQRGSQIVGAKLSDAAIVEIRSSRDSNERMAERYGVGRATISRARSGKTWKHIA
jgi:hypothetical protein